MAVWGPLLLLLAACSCCCTSSAFPHHLVQLSSRRSTCKPVPSSMSLCHGVGYSEMRLPNLLGHDTMKEALQQAASWVPLLTKQCHRETKKFLCSLFAPVCISQMEEPIFPCQSLCEAVRDSCVPVMAAFGFPWPEMLNCSRFPGGNELCIPPVGPEDREPLLREGRPPAELAGLLRGHQSPAKGLRGRFELLDAVCPACLDSGPSEKDFLGKVCNQDFALKMTVKSLSGVGGDLKVIPEVRGRMLYKQDGWSEEERKRLVLWLADGEACSCEELAGGPGTVVLAMGHRLGNRLILSWVRRWKHGEKELKRFSRAVRKLQC